MRFSQPPDAYTYEYEILRARNEIRDHFSKNFIRDIYENNGQLLSLIRFKLETLIQKAGCRQGKDIVDVAETLGTVARNLKQVSKLLSPETEILTEWGFVNALRMEIATENRKDADNLVVKGHPCSLTRGTVFILLQAVIEITAIIRQEVNDPGLSLEVIYTRRRMKIYIRFSGDLLPFIRPLQQTDNSYMMSLTLEERIRLINATIHYKKARKGRMEIQLVIHI